jgi:hypothetical protein
MSIVLVLSHVTAAIFAEIFQYPRPYWADNTVQGLGCDSTYLSINRISLLSYIFYWKLGYMLHRAVYDFPSACCGVSAKVCRRYNLCQLWVGMAVQLTTIPIAEFYLGKAYPDQILLAFLFGQVVLVLYGDFELPLKTFYDTLGKRKQIKFISALLLVFVGLICAAYISMLSAHVPAEYVENAAVWCGDESDPYVINKRQLFLDSVLEIVFLAFFIWGRQILIQHKNDQWHNISWKLCLVRFALTIGLISFFYYAFAGFDPVETNIYAMIFIQLIRGVFCGLSVSLFGPLLMYHCCCARCNGYLNPPGSQLATTAGGEDEVYEQM